MAYNRTYYFNFVSDAGITWRLEMYDQVAAGTYQDQEGTLGPKASDLKYGSDGSKMFAPLKPSTFSFEFMVTDQTSATYIKNLKVARKERDVYVALYRETVTGANAPIYTPYWAGQVLMDLSDDPDIPTPYPITIKAVDGIASLKYYDYLPTTTTQLGSHQYLIGETYIPDATNVGGQYDPWQHCIEIISNCLAYSGPFGTTEGALNDPQIYTFVRWFNGQMPNTTLDPLRNTRIKPNLFYKKITQENDVVKYEPKSCYDVIKDLCKAWGMRMFYFAGRYYFVQINNFRKQESGTQSNPDNMNRHSYYMDGTTHGSSDNITRWWGKYILPLTNDIQTGQYKNHKLAGGKYGLLPAFKRVTIDYMNVDNVNSFTSFPLLPTGGTTDPGAAGTYWEFSSLGTYTTDGVNNSIFFQRIYLDIYNNGVNTGDLTVEWVMVARPAGTGTNTLNTSPSGNGWTRYMYTDWTNPNFVVNLWSINMWDLDNGNLPFQSWHPIGIGPQSIDITTGSSSMFPVLPFNSAATNFAAGDWELGYYIKSPTTAGAALYWSGHGRFSPDGVSNPYTSPWINNVNYTNTAITQGINASEFAPIINGAVGSAMSTTNLEQTGDDTAFEVVTDIIMGDAGLLASEGALQIYDGSNWILSDISGVWGIDTLTGGNSFSQQLATDIIKAQAKPLDKFTVSTTIDASLSVYYNDGTANRPQWASPYTKFMSQPNAYQGMVQKAYIMHTGSFDFLTDTWKWVLYQQANFTLGSTTTTTTNTGGVNSGLSGGGGLASAPEPPPNNFQMPRMPNPVAGLEYVTSLLTRQKVNSIATIRVASLISRPNEGDPYVQTITSLSIAKLNNPIFKTGDKIVLQTQTNNLLPIVGENTNPDYNTNRISFIVSADQLANAETISVTSKIIYQDILVGDTITFDVVNLISQYQNKTEGTIAGFEVDADGLKKGGIEITGWLDSDTMTGATANNVPTAESVKAYVDASAGGTTPTLQEVTTAGNTTTNTITFAGGTSDGNITIQAASPVLKIDAPDSGYPEIYFTRLAGDDQNARIKLRANQLRFENAGDPDSTYLFQGRAAGSGSLSDFLKIEDTGITTTGGIFSNQITIPATPIATTDAASKSYVDAQSSTALSVFSMLICTATTITSNVNGVANAVVMKFDNEAITEGPTAAIISYGSSGKQGLENSQFCWEISANSTQRYFEFQWNVTSNTNTLNNRLLSGIRIQEGTEGRGALTFTEVSPTTSYIYDRGTGTIRKGSTAASIIIGIPASENSKFYRMQFWKESASNAAVKSESVLNGTQMTIKQLK